MSQMNQFEPKKKRSSNVVITWIVMGGIITISLTVAIVLNRSFGISWAWVIAVLGAGIVVFVAEELGK